MKKYILILFLFCLLSCKSQYQNVNDLNVKIEKLSSIKIATNNESLKTFKSRNIDLRNKMIQSYIKEINTNLNEEFYLIEVYDYDWGYNYYTYLIIGENVYCFLKNDFFTDYAAQNCTFLELGYQDVYSALSKKEYDRLLEIFLNKENCMSSTNIFIVSKDMKIKRSFIDLNCKVDGNVSE